MPWTEVDSNLSIPTVGLNLVSRISHQYWRLRQTHRPQTNEWAGIRAENSGWYRMPIISGYLKML